MKAVLISIHPKWVHKILDGKKTVEVRKTVPKIETPFKCYIYMTSGGREWRDPFSTAVVPPSGVGEMYCGAKRVVAEFICDRISTIAYTIDGFADVVDCDTSCLTPKDFIEYGKGKPLYGWDISDLVIYEKPKALRDFRYYNCSVYWENGYPMPTHEIKRPPQSWCYVEKNDL